MEKKNGVRIKIKQAGTHATWFSSPFALQGLTPKTDIKSHYSHSLKWSTNLNLCNPGMLFPNCQPYHFHLNKWKKVFSLGFTAGMIVVSKNAFAILSFQGLVLDCCILLPSILAPTRVARLRHGAKLFHDLDIDFKKSLKPEFITNPRNPSWAWAHGVHLFPGEWSLLFQDLPHFIALLIQGALLKSRMSGVRPGDKVMRYRIWKWNGEAGRDLLI